MPLGDFRSVFLPYVLIRQSDGRYVVVNREYKPLGFFTNRHVDYEKFPVAVKLKGITTRLAKKVSARGDPSIDRIYLYNDGCVPTHSKQNMDAYLHRLALLADIDVDEDVFQRSLERDGPGHIR